jgi:hypothetical protein
MQKDDVAFDIGSLGSNACVELFDAYGVELERLQSGETAFRASDECVMSGVIGFVGKNVRGTCLLAGNDAPLEASCPPGGQLRDWVGELANQLVGRLKRKLLARGVEVALTTPLVLSGVRLQPLPRGKLTPTVFSTSSGDVMVWIEVEVDQEFSLGDERAHDEVAEGALVLF